MLSYYILFKTEHLLTHLLSKYSQFPPGKVGMNRSKKNKWVLLSLQRKVALKYQSPSNLCGQHVLHIQPCCQTEKPSYSNKYYASNPRSLLSSPSLTVSWATLHYRKGLSLNMDMRSFVQTLYKILLTSLRASFTCLKSQSRTTGTKPSSHQDAHPLGWQQEGIFFIFRQMEASISHTFPTPPPWSKPSPSNFP